MFKTNLPFFSILAIVLLAFAACKTTQIIGANRLDSKHFEKALKQPNTVLVDVRTSTEYDSAHIPNALLADWKNKTAFMQVVKSFDTSKTYLLYCRTGKRSLAAADTLRTLGFSKVYDLTGGIANWNGPVEKKQQQ
jgi:rhodanese-related sulfurtransferase